MLSLTFRNSIPKYATEFVEISRGMATLKDIALRLKSVKNIQKITKSMKMVSAAKYNRAERDLRPARPYGQGSREFYEKSDVASCLPTQPEHLLLAMTSDRGLCGAANTSIIRAVRQYIQNHPEEESRLRIVTVGDKARSALHRAHGNKIILQVTEVGKKFSTFDDAAAISMALLSSGYAFDKASMFYNTFKSVVSYQTTLQPLYSVASLQQAERLALYDSVDDEILRSYNEFALASLVFFAMKEGATSEQSARMTAMDAASKNAGEMIGKLTLLFNRTRQAAITRELVEIISGAAALK